MHLLVVLLLNLSEPQLPYILSHTALRNKWDRICKALNLVPGIQYMPRARLLYIAVHPTTLGDSTYTAIYVNSALWTCVAYNPSDALVPS